MNATLTTTPATINRIAKGPYVLHSYLSPASAEMVCSQIIETPTSLLIVDVQLLREHARAVRNYAASLGKPINKIIISHCHPDHWAGLEEFEGVPAYALPETIWEIENYGQAMLDSKQPAFGNAVTRTVSLPAVLPVERENLDGLELVYRKNTGTESTFSLAVQLPQLHTLVAQDLVYNGVYPYVGDRSYVTKEYPFNNWIRTLEQLKTEGYELVLPGHGLPTDASSFDTMIDTLTYAKSVFETAADGEELKRRMMEKYPNYQVVDMLDLSAYMLYNNPYGY
jgi:glyoxylase-like metal-dependent hydrolase (beta-lactamase superfamily II)